jgi:hypothetical protein
MNDDTPNVIPEATNVGFINVPESFFETSDPLTNEQFREDDEVIVVLHTTPGMPPPELLHRMNVNALNMPIPEIPNVVTRFIFKRQPFEIYVRHFEDGSDVLLPIHPPFTMFTKGVPGSKRPEFEFQIGQLRAIERTEANQVAINNAGRAAFQRAQNARNAALAVPNENVNIEPEAAPGFFGRVWGAVGNTVRGMVGRGRTIRKRNNRRKHRTYRNRRNNRR